MTVFQVEADKPLQTVLDIPGTHYLLHWNPYDRAYQVVDVCGWTNFFLTRQIRRMLRGWNTAQVFHMIGKVIQRYAKANAA